MVNLNYCLDNLFLLYNSTRECVFLKQRSQKCTNKTEAWTGSHNDSDRQARPRPSQPERMFEMQLIRTVKEIQEFVKTCKAEEIHWPGTHHGCPHEGHASLIAAAHKENQVVIVSDFVNPTQFGPNEDYDAYPRKLEADSKVAEAAGATVLFAPSPAEMYPHKDMTWVEVTGNVTKVLCGRTRPIHFRGVTTVVSKLMHLSQADRAYFGLKDAQQTEVLRRMVEDLFMPVELRIMPIIREADGLAKRAPGTYLSPEERKAALVLSRSLKHAKEAFDKERMQQRCSPKAGKDEISAEPLSNIDYVEMYGMPGLTEVEETISGRVLLAVAVKFGTTRLIDNVVLEA